MSKNTKKNIVFDTGPIISLVTNNLLWILEPLKTKFQGRFYITPNVKRELIDKALKTKRFEFEAMQISRLIKKGILEVVSNNQINILTKKLMNLANQSFKSKGKWIKIVSDAEMEALAADTTLGSEATIIDERTARLLLENTPNMTALMEKRFHTKVEPNISNIREFKKLLKNVQILRSTELAVVAYKMGLLNDYLIDRSSRVKNPKKMLLDAILWAVKVRGCGISSQEINEIVKAES